MYVELRNINKTFSNYKAADNVNFAIKKGKLIGLLGPSGSGKTTILKIIAGLETPDSGDIIINGEKVNNIDAGKRGIGFVFQSYALFRHQTVEENIAFGLKVQKLPKADIKDRVSELIELVGLSGMEKRYPHQLSGGQRQRVAFARALAPNPKLLLLDEPFAAIDAKVRKELRLWLKSMIQKLGITSIFVTHDQDEAVEVADEIIVTNKGKIEQIGTPIEIYKNPKTSFVAHFIGESSIIESYNQFNGFENEKLGAKAVIRPEFIEVSRVRGDIQFSTAAEEGTIESTFFRGNSIELKINVKGHTVSSYWSMESEQLSEGDKVFVLIHRLFLFDDHTAKIVENSKKFDPMPVYI